MTARYGGPRPGTMGCSPHDHSRDHPAHQAICPRDQGQRRRGKRKWALSMARTDPFPSSASACRSTIESTPPETATRAGSPCAINRRRAMTGRRRWSRLRTGGFQASTPPTLTLANVSRCLRPSVQGCAAHGALIISRPRGRNILIRRMAGPQPPGNTGNLPVPCPDTPRVGARNGGRPSSAWKASRCRC